ncbi:malate dehydrogenase [Aneurinibacillus migulanus]|uniref:Malate dehydrogenase n=1 Tax=Aneurinibacillus migulanus TaxID=47500 RepID=A0A0D1XA35_ANEMI|nr:NAD-dependent malic enzyme [Aneurinibacillus migulanus]KIV51266.1 malate dehydrogenase [Aneurinibacillus migulanus]KIV51633.1 malate dehydrogenase [Aneurinibacillus migulanus]KON94736.1 malate dehydrogenase [Aneurinibacillus migulanus]KPD08336.1 malate dehydrogenase [Aneurinibacillus migulanus]MCP1354566.1 NAD-dependent malic enzyme [Aneurinibacillus migulanus]
MKPFTSLGTSIILRLEMDVRKVNFVDIATAVGKANGDIVAMDVVQSSNEVTVRDYTINTKSRPQIDDVINNIEALPGVEIITVSDRTFLSHIGGKIEVRATRPIQNREDLSRVYTPGVASVCEAIAKDQSKAYKLTIKSNTVAIVSDGTAVLGLGDIGPYAAMPVMEGKAMLFKQLAKVDGFPICLDTKDTEEIIETIVRMAPAFGGINLEDISAPRCFEIEKALRERLDIPVFHDDQHGTAVVILAGLLNALKIVGKDIKDCKIVVTGMGAAGVSCTKILLSAGAKQVIGVDRDGILSRSVTYENPIWEEVSNITNPDNLQGELKDALIGADVFIGVSRGNILSKEMVQTMAKDPIVFAMANPNPEIDPEEAAGVVRVLATGRSDYPNQINNVLCFPGIFRGAFDCRATDINEEMKVAAAHAIASIISEEELNEQYIIPSVFNDRVVKNVRDAVVNAAIKTGVARKVPRDKRKKKTAE